jgi:hypothetical protein
MSKYTPLKEHLSRHGASVTMTFDEVANLVGGLPASAFEYAPWWAKEHSTHVQARAWMEAGFAAHPNLTARMVRFGRT